MSAPAVTTVLQVDFHRERPRRAAETPQGRVPRVARLLALAQRIDAMIHDGELRDYADASRALGLTRARITQITNLLLLAPAIQEAILMLPAVVTGRDPITERRLRRIVTEPDWNKQIELWRQNDE